MNEKYIIIFGNFSTGYEFVGPFDSLKEADEYARVYGEEYGWGEWITTLLQPKEIKNK